MSDTQLFAFEQDFVATLRCVPMAVRLKLDVCGVKLSLRQWSRFSQDERRCLLLRPCETEADITAYHAALIDLIARRSNETARPLAAQPGWQWDDLRGPPAPVADYAIALGLGPPSDNEWRTLTRLQRFALVKLTRDSHENANFLPAVIEFGLARPPALRD